MGFLSLMVASVFLASTVACLPILVLRNSGTQTCGPASWETIVLFYLLNYGAHAMTVVGFPGEREPISLMWATLALLLPYSGIGKACISIACSLPGTRDPLKRALYAGALCEVVEGDSTLLLKTRKIHGRASLPSGYTFSPIILTGVSFTEFEATSFHKISSSQSHLKSCIAICQLLFSCFTLYHTRGNQIQLYGYAAFGFTVVPYAVMSVVNLVSNLLVPHYPTLYLVRTPLMNQAEEAGGRFEGVVGTVPTTRNPDADLDVATLPVVLFWFLLILAIITPYIILKAMTNFDAGDSTPAQRGWTMGWLAVGQLYGLLTAGAGLVFWMQDPDTGSRLPLSGHLLGLVVPSAAGIGGFVVVGQMLVVHGQCSTSTAL